MKQYKLNGRWKIKKKVWSEGMKEKIIKNGPQSDIFVLLMNDCFT